MMDSVIQFRGTIYENGYGLIASKVMRDKRLPKQSKLIYAYMCSFAGVDENGNRSAFPSISLQCDELGMNEDTYYKWRKYLVQYGYITIEKQKNDHGKFDRNLYIIEAVPVEKEPEKTEIKPTPKKSGTVKSGTGKRGTNSTSSNSTSSNTYINNIKDNIDDDKRTFPTGEVSTNHNDEQLNSIISNLREATKDELSIRSFKAIVKKVVSKYNQGEVNDFRNYLTTALLKKIEELDFRRQKEKAKQEIELSKKQRMQERLGNAADEPARKMPFYNWLEA